MMKKAAVLLADGFEEAEALVPFDVLKRAGISVDLVSVEGKDSVKAAHGVVVTDLVPMEGYDFQDCDALILPGGSGGYKVLKAQPRVHELAEKFAASPDRILGAICAAAALIGEWGLLKGKNYVCFPGMNGDFGGTYHQEHSVTDGNIVTGISAGGSFQFGFGLVECLIGREAAEEVRHQSWWLTK